MSKPKAQWQQQDPSLGLDGLVWVSYLDNRFQCEVHRIAGVTHQGTFYIWDHNNGDVIVHQEETGLAYDAKFGPDIDDQNRWCTKGIEVADNKYAEEKDKETRLGEDVN